MLPDKAAIASAPAHQQPLAGSQHRHPQNVDRRLVFEPQALMPPAMVSNWLTLVGWKQGVMGTVVLQLEERD